MKPWMKQHIRQNLPDLINVIKWNEGISAALESNDFSEYDISAIESKPEEYTRVRKLLDLLVTKGDESYVCFMKILQRHQQQEAFVIFEAGLKAKDPATWEHYVEENSVVESPTGELVKNDKPGETQASQKPESSSSNIKFNFCNVEVELPIQIPTYMQIPIFLMIVLVVIGYNLYFTISKAQS